MSDPRVIDTTAPLTITALPIVEPVGDDSKNDITSLNEVPEIQQHEVTPPMTEDVSPAPAIDTPVVASPAVTPVPRFSAKWDDKSYTRYVSNADKFPGIAYFEVFSLDIVDSHGVWEISPVTYYSVWRLNELNTVTANKYVSELAAQGEDEVLVVVAHDVSVDQFTIPSDVVAFLAKLNA